MSSRYRILFVAAFLVFGVPANAADGKQVLRYWSFLDPSSKDSRSVAQTQMIEAFTQANPDIEVKVEVVHWSKMVPLVVTAAGAGQAPDVALIHSTRIPEAAEARAIVPIDGYLNQLSSEADDFLLPLKNSAYKNKIYSIPVELRIEGMLLYRKDLFQKAGITAPPKTWSDLAAYAAKLNQPPVWGFAWALSRKDAAANVKYLETEYWGAGGAFYNADGSATVNSPIGLRLAQTISDLAFKQKVMPPNVVGVEESRSMMKGGTVAMLVEGTHVYQSLRSNRAIGDNLATAPLPTLDASQYPPPAQVSGQTLAITKDAKQPDLAWRFVKFMTGPQAQLISAKTGINLPVRKSVFTDAFFSSPEGSIMQEWKTYIVEHGRPPALNTFADYMADTLGLAYEQVLSRSKDPQAALDEAAARYDDRRKAAQK